MARWVRSGLAQAAHPLEDRSAAPARHREAALLRWQELIGEAASQGCQLLCLPALATGPYLGFETDPRWRDLGEPLAEGPTFQTLAPLARAHDMVLVVPMLEADPGTGGFHTALVIDADGQLAGAARQIHVPVPAPHAAERTFFRGATQPPAVIRTRHAVLGVLVGHDRHFADAARVLGRQGAEVVCNPCAASEGLAHDLWLVEGPAHAARHGYYLLAVNRVEAPCFGHSYACDPGGELLACADATEQLLMVELDLDRVGSAGTVTRV